MALELTIQLESPLAAAGPVVAALRPPQVRDVSTPRASTARLRRPFPCPTTSLLLRTGHVGPSSTPQRAGPCDRTLYLLRGGLRLLSETLGAIAERPQV